MSSGTAVIAFVKSFVGKDLSDGAQEETAIKAEAHPTYIISVEACLFDIVEAVPPADLRKTREAGADIVCAVFLPLQDDDLFALQADDGTGTDDAHFSPEDVDELWQLVQTVLSECPAAGEHVSVPFRQELLRQVGGRIPAHRAEFQKLEAPLSEPYPRLPEHCRTGILQLDHERDDEHGDAEYQKTDERQQNIEPSLEYSSIHAAVSIHWVT